MIHEIIIKNLNRSKFEYVLDNESKKMNVLSKTKSIKFEKGLNVIIGENGSGKSTLINMLSSYTCCTTGETDYIFSPTSEGSISKLFDIKNKLLDGIDVKNYYSVKVFKLILDKERSTSNVLDSIANFASYYNSTNLSEGEKLIHAISNTLRKMFNSDLACNMKQLARKDMNDLWLGYQKDFVEYLKQNNVKEDEPIFSLIMDEPDRNLDILNINQVKEILCNQKPNGQMIISLHNPLLIYALSKQNNINFIELTKGYKNKVVNEVDSLLK